jgi:histidyl-tRNA synthetase
VPFVAIYGDDERARGEVAIKDMRSGDQTSMPWAAAAGYIREKLEVRS